MYDFQGAIKAGANPNDVMNFMAKQTGYNASGATQAGANLNDVLAYMAKLPMQTTQPTPVQQASPSVGGFLKNAVSSVGNLIGGVGSAVLHPIDTLTNLSKVGAGAVETGLGAVGAKDINGTPLSQQQTPEKQSFKNVVGYFGQRYGGSSVQEVGQNIAKTAYNDPAGFLLDLSSLIDAGSSALGKVGEVSKIGGLSTAAETAGKVSDVINPISNIEKGAAVVGKGTATVGGKLGGEALGITTGAGFGAVKEAFQNGGEAFTKAMRGETSADQVVQTAKDALGAVKQARSDSYTSQLADIAKNKASLDISPVVKEMDSQLSKFNIGKNADGTLDFGRSSIRFDKEAQATVNTIYDQMKTFGTKAGDRTAVGVDSLKRALGDLYSPSSQVRAFTTAVAGKARSVLSDVPGYDALSANYAEKTNFIKQTQKALSLGDKASVDTSFNKLTSTLRQNTSFRQDLVKELQQFGGKDITGQIAGTALSGAVPRGIVGKGLEALSGGGAIFLHDPTFVVGLAAATPRVVGEFVRALGITTKMLHKWSDVLQSMGAGEAANNLLKSGYYINKSINQGQAPQPSQ